MTKRERRLYRNHKVFGLIGIGFFVLAFLTYNGNFSASMMYAFFGLIAAVMSEIFWERI